MSLTHLSFNVLMEERIHKNIVTFLNLSVKVSVFQHVDVCDRYAALFLVKGPACGERRDRAS